MLDSRPTVAWPPTTVAWPFGEFFTKSFLIAWNVQKRCLTVSRRSRDLRPLSRDRSATFFKIFPNCLKRPKNVVWQSADGRVTSDHCRVTVQRLFSKLFFIAWNVQKTLFDSRPTVAWPQPLSRDRSATFFKIFPNCLKRPKNVVWQSADGRVTSNHCRVTVQRLFSKFSQIAWNVQKTLFDSRPTVAWPPTTVAWPFSDFFQNFFLLLETSKNVVWQSADGRVTSDHCRVTVQRLFSKFSQIAWNVQKTLFDSRPTVAWPRPLSRDRSATFFKIFPNRLKRPKNVVWQSADGRVTSTTVAWPFSDFFQNFPKSLETSKKRCLTVGRRSRDLRPLSRDRSATFFKIFPKLLETSKKRCLTVGRRSRDLNHCRVTVQRLFSKFSQIAWNVQKRCLTVGRRSRDLNHCRVTVQRLFSKFSQIAWNVQKTLFDSRPTVAWPQPLSRDRSATFFKIFPNRLKRPKNVVWQSADGRVTSTTVAWPFSDFFQNFPKSLETSKKRCLTVGRQSRDLLPLSRDRSATFFKKISNCLKRPKNVVWQSADGRVTSTTVAWPFSDFFQNFPKSLETS